MPTGLTQVTSTLFKDSQGALVQSATIIFTPVDNAGRTISFKSGAGGQATCSPIAATITNGAFTVQLADIALTTPINVAYSVQVIDNVTGKSILGRGYEWFQPTGSSVNFDLYSPLIPAQGLLS